MSETIAKKKKSRKGKGMFGKQSKPKGKLNLFSKMKSSSMNDDESNEDPNMADEEEGM
jgi:hypothetical protein